MFNSPFYLAALLLVYVVISVSGLTFLKLSGGNLFGGQGLVGFMLYGLGFLLFFYMLSRTPISYIFPIAAGALIIGTQLAGYAVFHESITLTHILGILLILSGIYCLNFQT